MRPWSPTAGAGLEKTLTSASRGSSGIIKEQEMTPRFPVERAEKRQALLRAVESVRDVLAAGVNEGEELRTLPPASVAALRDSGLFLLKAPTVLGGAEADPVTQLDVIEAVSHIDPAAGWCLFLCADTAGLSGAFLSDAAVAQIFPGDHVPT